MNKTLTLEIESHILIKIFKEENNRLINKFTPNF